MNSSKTDKKQSAKTITLFDEVQVRRHWNADNELWYFSVIDVVA